MSKVSRDDAVAAMNKAADVVLDALEPLPDEGARDVVNLMVNAGAYFLDHPDGTLDDAIAAGYDSEPGEVIEWCRS